MTPDQTFPKSLLNQADKQWVLINTGNGIDTEAVDSLNRFLPDQLPSGQPSPKIACKPPSKTKFVTANLPKVLDNQAPPQCICLKVTHQPQHTHPTIVQGRKHICTTDIAILLRLYPKAAAALSLPPNFRANRKADTNDAIDRACEAWVLAVAENVDDDLEPAIQAASTAATHTRKQANARSKKFQKHLPEGWEVDLKRFHSQGGVSSFGDKEETQVILCQVLAIHMTQHMLTNTKRYVKTTLSEQDALDVLAYECEEAIGGVISAGEKLPILQAHVKTHKRDKPNGMELRPTTNSRQKGAYIHHNILKQILDKATMWAKTKSDYTCLNSTTDLVTKLPTHLPRASTADVRGFFTEISHNSIRKYMTRLITQMFKEYTGRYLYATQKSAAWCMGGADDIDPNSYGPDKIIRLISVLLSNDYTTIGGVVYVAKEGVPMGASISSHLSNLTMWMLERLALPILRRMHEVHNLGVFFHARYVDDCIHSSPKDLFNAIMTPILSKASCEYESDPTEDEYSKGIPFLEIKVKLLHNGQVTTSHYSRKVEINPDTTRLPTKGGATANKTYTQAVRMYCRTAYTVSTTLNSFVTDIKTLTRKTVHPNYSTRAIARIAVQVLLLPHTCRYGKVTDHNKLERDIRQFLQR
jgi:hypothetical protein